MKYKIGDIVRLVDEEKISNVPVFCEQVLNYLSNNNNGHDFILYQIIGIDQGGFGPRGESAYYKLSGVKIESDIKKYQITGNHDLNVFSDDELIYDLEINRDYKLQQLEI